MDARKLMVGDWVYLKNGKVLQPCKITVIGNATQDRSKIGATVCLDLSEEFPTCLFSIDSIEPIPLTPEILEKNGFITEERESDPTFPYLAFIIDNDEYRVEITWYDSHDVYEPNTGEYLHGAPEVWSMEILGNKCGNYDCGKNKLYLHELQHALKLCCIEKTIEL